MNNKIHAIKYVCLGIYEYLDLYYANYGDHFYDHFKIVHNTV